MDIIDASIPLQVKPPKLQTAYEAESQRLSLQEKRLQAQQGIQDFKDRQTLRTVLQQTGGDLEKAQPLIMQVNPKLGLDIRKELDGMQQHVQELKQKRLEFEATKTGYLDQAESQDEYDKRLYTLKAAGFDVTKEATTPWQPSVKQKTAEARTKLQDQMEKDKVAHQYAQEDLATKRQTALEDQANEREKRQHELAMAQIQNIATDNARQAAQAAEVARHNKVEEGFAGQREKRESAQDVGISLTPQGLDIAAENFAKTGQLPPMGMGKQSTAVRSRIINRAAELHPEMDLASARAGFAADEGSLKGLQKQRDSITAFENTALKNIDIFLGEAGKVVDTGSPLANTAARMVTGKVLGSKDQAGYDAARQVALNEVAKIVSNPNLTGQLSDTARKEISGFNPEGATLKQTVEVMRILKQDMANRKTSYDQQIGEIKGRIKGGAASTPAATGQPKEGDTKPIPGYPGTEQTYKNGKWIRTK